MVSAIFVSISATVGRRVGFSHWVLTRAVQIAKQILLSISSLQSLRFCKIFDHYGEDLKVDLEGLIIHTSINKDIIILPVLKV